MNKTNIIFSLVILSHVSPESGYYSFCRFVSRTTASADTYNLSGQLAESRDTYSFTNLNPAVKLLLTVRF